MISRVLAKRYPQHVRAVHLNFAPVLPWKMSRLSFLWSLLTTVPFSAKDRAHLAATWTYINQGNGYLRQQETRPQTLGYALQDSPVALLAWIYDKLHTWTDGYPWTDEEILTWVSIYQFSTAGPAASARIYYEAQHNDSKNPEYVSGADALAIVVPSNVKIAVMQTPKEIIRMPPAWYRLMGNVIRETEFEVGGHFAAWEIPELVSWDLKSFFSETKRGGAFGPAREERSQSIST